jgi:hypothetical protein
MVRAINNDDYEHKFSGFIALCSQSDSDLVIVHHPQVLGDNYEEIVESLSRLANAEKKLLVLPQKLH